MSEDALVNILDYLKQFQNQTQDEIELAGYIKKIITEDKNLLARLAK